jgi:hypothetical protein
MSFESLASNLAVLTIGKLQEAAKSFNGVEKGEPKHDGAGG